MVLLVREIETKDSQDSSYFGDALYSEINHWYYWLGKIWELFKRQETRIPWKRRAILAEMSFHLVVE